MDSLKGSVFLEKLQKYPSIFIFAFFVLIIYVIPFHPVAKPVISTSTTPGIDCNPAAAAEISFSEAENHPGYAVYTEGCKIPDMDPFDNSIEKFLEKGRSFKCNRSFSKINGTRLTINVPVLEELNMTNCSCCYWELYRVTQDPKEYRGNADNSIRYSDTCHPIPLDETGVTVNTSYVKVQCHGGGIDLNLENEDVNKTVEFQAVVLPPYQISEEGKGKAEFWHNRKSQGMNNINFPSFLIIGIDSISRMNFIRSSLRTRAFLERNDFVEMRGYTKAGESTFPNVMAGFAGLNEDNYSSCWPSSYRKFDDCPFLWRKFSDLNYITAFVEDRPTMAIFNYAKVGFVLPPTDYYLRPLALAVDMEPNQAGCVGGLPPNEFYIGFISDFVKEMGKQYPYFLFSWLSSVGHGDLNGFKNVDYALKNLLETALNESMGNPENTVIIFMSDHGFRFGGFRETFLGYYEDSLPFFFIRLPPSLKERHPEWYQNLKRNSRQLVSPLDLHSTLMQILNEVNGTGTSNLEENLSEKLSPQFRSRYSFFEYIPNNRTCESATIPQRYCMCGVTPAVSQTSTLSMQFGDIIVQNVNGLLENAIESGDCATLKFSKILYGREIDKEEEEGEWKDYLVAVETIPSMAHFEGKLRAFRNSTVNILGNVIRINAYKGQSDCVTDYKLKSYCVCKSYLEEQAIAEKRREEEKKEFNRRKKKDKGKKKKS